jgi:3-oxoacyl-[acyl-carrier protein] reductase
MSAPGPARVALVTGAGRGLGRHTAIALGEAGLSVGLLGRSPGGLTGVQNQIDRSGGRATTAIADVRDLPAVEAAVAAIEAELGPIDLLVNNAGVIEPSEVPVWAADPGEWWDVVETDLRGPFHLIKAVVPGMIERGAGRVVNLSSGAGAADREIYSAYCAAKAGLFRISGNLHLAGYDQGIRAFEVSPGVVETDMTHSMRMHDARTDWTPPSALTDLILAAARGDLDAWSGAFIRAGIDTPESLSKRAEAGGLPPTARRLGILPYGDDDPLA